MRPLKPHKVDAVSVAIGRAHVDADVMWDRDRKVFFVAVGKERAEADTLDACKVAGKDLLWRFHKPYEWKPVIVVEEVGAEDDTDRRYGDGIEREDCELSFTFFRMEVAERPDLGRGGEPKRLFRKHVADFEEELRRFDEQGRDFRRRQRAALADVHERIAGGGGVELPYSEATWAGLQAVKRSFLAARAKLHALTAGSPDVLAYRLAGVGRGDGASLLLASGSKPIVPRRKPR